MCLWTSENWTKTYRYYVVVGKFSLLRQKSSCAEQGWYRRVRYAEHTFRPLSNYAPLLSFNCINMNRISRLWSRLRTSCLIGPPSLCMLRTAATLPPQWSINSNIVQQPQTIELGQCAPVWNCFQTPLCPSGSIIGIKCYLKGMTTDCQYKWWTLATRDRHWEIGTWLQ